MENIIRDRPMETGEGILHHEEGVDLIPANIELSGMEMLLVNAMSREFSRPSVQGQNGRGNAESGGKRKTVWSAFTCTC